MARALEGLGVKLGDLVTIGLPNGVNFIAVSWGVWKLGATPQLVSFRLPRAELKAIIDLADLPVVIALPTIETNLRRVMEVSGWSTAVPSAAQAGGEIKIIDADGNIRPPGKVGEIYLRGCGGATPFYEYRGATAHTLPDGWEGLGDVGHFDEDGYLYLTDRRADMIVVGGANIYPAQVKGRIDEHPLVISSAVVRLLHEDMGWSVHAIVQARPGLSAEMLLAHLTERLVTYKLPRRYCWNETAPLSKPPQIAGSNGSTTNNNSNKTAGEIRSHALAEATAGGRRRACVARSGRACEPAPPWPCDAAFGGDPHRRCRPAAPGCRHRRTPPIREWGFSQ